MHSSWKAAAGLACAALLGAYAASARPAAKKQQTLKYDDAKMNPASPHFDRDLLEKWQNISSWTHGPLVLTTHGSRSRESRRARLSAKTARKRSKMVRWRSKFASARSELLSPSEIPSRSRCDGWSGRQDSNLRPPGPEPVTNLNYLWFCPEFCNAEQGINVAE